MKKKILVIDDQIFLQRLIEAALLKNNYEYFSALSSEDGIIKSIESKPDLILLDFMLPDITGIETLEKLKINNQTKNIPVVMLTGKSDEDIIKKAFAAGAVRYIKKPFEPKYLLKVLNSIFIENELLESDNEERIYELLESVKNENLHINENIYKKLIINFNQSRKLLADIVHIIGVKKIEPLKIFLIKLLKNSGIQPVREKCVWALGQFLTKENIINNSEIIEILYSTTVNESESIELRLIACVALRQIGYDNITDELFNELNKKYYDLL